MTKFYSALLWSSTFYIFLVSAEESRATIPPSSQSPQSIKASENLNEGFVLFTPPAGWRLADALSLPAHVRAMVVGTGPSAFPPSMNLSWEPYKGTLKQYLKTVKNLNNAQGFDWKDLGSIQTEAGNASLSQVDTKTQWGDVRLMHVIMIKDSHVYILTASALKDEFSMFYKDFFSAMRSLRVANDVYDMVVDPQQRIEMKSATEKLKTQWDNLIIQKQHDNPSANLSEMRESLFNSHEFQETCWKPFQEMLKQKYGNFGPEWQTLVTKKIKDQFIHVQPKSQPSNSKTI